ncbi:MAG: enoyl-CoA hydratase [Planctomycetota bacterium]|nr:MAG: enoyl-CoA hydratase [Planctomycetota bacterium]
MTPNPAPATETLSLELCPSGVLKVTLQRERRHNAFNAQVIQELSEAFGWADQADAVRVVLLQGAGPSFSAGADIEWMRQQGSLGHAENVESARQMASCFEAIHSCRKPVVAAVHGAALGGGTGLTAAADIAICEESTVFGFTEVRLGILPAVISPYVVEKLGSARARALFLLGSRFRGREAERLGLVFRCVPDGQLEAEVEGCLAELSKGAPSALIASKRLALSLNTLPPAGRMDFCAEEIARQRGTLEAQEGLAAFLDKRQAKWIQSGSSEEKNA